MTTERKSWKCRLGFHAFPWPPHKPDGFSLWRDFRIECARGCGARTVRTCDLAFGGHWRDKHPEGEA